MSRPAIRGTWTWRDRINPHRGPGPRPTDRLLVECWCRAHTDIVDAALIRAGTTWCCDNPECHPPKGTR